MALTKDELLEMINSTISTNGTKAITGDALNAALTAIVETMGGSTYVFPQAMWEAMEGYSNPYVFTQEEAAAFRHAWANRDIFRFFAVGTRYDGAIEFSGELAGYYDKDSLEYYFGAGGQTFWDNVMIDLCIRDNDGELIAYYN